MKKQEKNLERAIMRRVDDKLRVYDDRNQSRNQALEAKLDKKLEAINQSLKDVLDQVQRMKK